MTTYYVSAEGNDTATGLTPALAWKTMAKVNSVLGTVGPGDTILFRRGDTFPGRFGTIPAGTATGPWFNIGSYGDGPRPCIDAYKHGNDSTKWVEHATGVWKLNITAASGDYTGDTVNNNTDVGHLTVSNSPLALNGIKGVKRSTLGALANDWDFYSDATHVYVKLTTNPAASGRTVAIATQGAILAPKTKLSVSGLEMKGSGSHAINGAAGVHHFRLFGNEIHSCGGSYLDGFGDGTVRYGNGVQAWIGTSHWDIEYNDIHDIWEAGITYQGAQSGSDTSWMSLHARFNTIRNCGWSFEFFSQGTDGAGFVDCSFSDNICINGGFSWGQAVRPDAAGRGAHLVFYEQQLPADLAIKRNVFFGAATNYLFALSGFGAGLDLNENTVFLAPGTKVQHQTSHTIENAAAWAADTGMDRNSTFIVAPRTPANGAQIAQLLAAHTAAGNAQLRVLERAVNNLGATQAPTDQAFTKPVFVPAAEFVSVVGTPTLSNVNRYPAWLLDPAASEMVAATVRPPQDWKYVKVEAVWANTAAGSGDVVLRLDKDFWTIGSTANSPTAGSSVTATAGATNVVMKTTLLASFPTVAGRDLVLNVLRQGAVAGDTLGNDIALIGVLLSSAD